MAARGRAVGRALAFALILLLALASIAPSGLAYHSGATRTVATEITETISIPVNNYSAYTFTIGRGDRLTYSIRVATGTQVDMYIVPLAGLEDYINDSTSTFSLYFRAENLLNITDVFVGTAGNSGLDAVIVDNVDFSGAAPTGAVTVSVSLRREIAGGPALAVLGGILIAVIVVIVIVALLIVRVRRKRAAMPPPAIPPVYPGPPSYMPPSAFPPYSPPAYQPPYPQGAAPGQAITRERGVIREIARVPCKYCGTLVESTARACPSCNGPLP